LFTQERLGNRLRDTVEPHAVRGHALAKTKLDSVRTEMFAIHLAHGTDHASDIRVLAKCKSCQVLLLYLDFLQNKISR
jgi:hypothetical protein